MRAFHWWRSGNKKRTQNVSEYMLVLALCLVMTVIATKVTMFRFKHRVLQYRLLRSINSATKALILKDFNDLIPFHITWQS